MPVEKRSKKIIILYIITGLNTGGAEIMLCNILSGINKENITPVVISLIEEGNLAYRLKDMGVQVYSMNMQQGKIPSVNTLLKLVKLAARIRPDIIQGWMYHGNIAARLPRFFLFRKIPVLWTIHHSVESLTMEKSMTAKLIRAGAWLSKLPARIIYVSEVSRKQHALLGYYDKRSCVITNGVDTDLFVPSPDYGLSVREELKLPEDSFLVGLLARYHPMKDHENFLKAAALLQDRRPGVHFILAGTDVDRHNEALQEMVQRYKIRHISMLGELADDRALVAALDIVCLSSSYGEAFPLIILEAMSCEVSCVSTDLGDIATIIGHTGRVVPPRNPVALADALESLMQLDKESRKFLGSEARARVKANYSLQSVVSKYEALYYSILK